MRQTPAALVLALWALGACDGCKKTIAAFPEKYAGVGVELAIEKDRPRVIEIHLGGPAEKAGMATGDVILEVDGIDTAGLTLSQVVDRLRGDEGSMVAVRYQRGNEVRESRLARSFIKKSKGGGYRGE